MANRNTTKEVQLYQAADAAVAACDALVFGAVGKPATDVYLMKLWLAEEEAQTACAAAAKIGPEAIRANYAELARLHGVWANVTKSRIQ